MEGNSFHDIKRYGRRDMSHIQRYLQQISSNLDCDSSTKKELIEEFQDHLKLLKKEYMEKGLSEDIAEKCAVFDFGEYKPLQQKLNQTLNPFKIILKVTQWLFLGIYTWFILMACFIGKFDNLSYIDNAERGVTLRFNWGANLYPNHNLIPLKGIDQEIVSSIFWVARRNAFDITFFNTALGVVLLFIPLGFFLPVLFKVNTLKKILTYSVVMGVSMELLQFITHTGIVDVNDTLFYVIGSAIGWFMFSSIRKVKVQQLGNVKA
ncbi:VanZ family protein [Paenibacillus sp. sptzw28]|uniref:VanZ family protein n=1 Tax=Paenibacillus sp. sptzw28 TaxID=715179 RepID=UPI001C6F32FC|nr:VanZ family protein [Paenibacillus sp. sptzw28]QYR22326.1 VanZ family protein [Paenibacillus sp. sptzw28]